MIAQHNLNFITGVLEPHTYKLCSLLKRVDTEFISSASGLSDIDDLHQIYASLGKLRDYRSSMSQDCSLNVL